MRGTLFLVVGPSGAGKDTLLAAAKAHLAGDPRFHFVRRAITRPAEAGGEDHEPLTEAEFAAREAAGAFALSWRAHGLAYGVPADIEDRLAQGVSVVVNVSRGVIDAARRRFQPVRVVLVTAPPSVLAERLAARGREAAADIHRRLLRAGEVRVAGADVATITNVGPVEDGVRRLLAVLGAPTTSPVV